MKQLRKQNISKKQLVKNWLLAGRKLTQRQCSRLFGADRLADIVFNLRKEGMNIETIWTDGQDRFLNDVHFATYKWLGEVPKIKFLRVNKKHNVKQYLVEHKFPTTNKKMLQHVRDYLKKLKVGIKSIRYTSRKTDVQTITVVTATDTRMFAIVQNK